MRDDILRRMADELAVLHAAWVLADDDNRKRKPLLVSPDTARRWKALAAEARAVGAK